MCSDLANNLTVCMSLRAEWKPPTFDIPASSAGPQTTTVISMAPVTTVTAVETIYQVPQTVCGTVTRPEVITVTVPTPPQPQIVTVYPQPQPRPLNLITVTLPRPLPRQARETAAPLSRRSAFTEATCLPCEDNADCEVS
jgi:hypothetical protein